MAKVGWPALYAGGVHAAEADKTAGEFEVERIERTTVKVPFREVPQRAMDRELPHWRYSEIIEVHLRCGAVGHGETLLYYTWGVPTDEAVSRAVGKNAASLVWNDSLGAGLQMALFDAVARGLDVPIHRLLGKQVHDKTPLSWWNIDMPPEDMAAECAEAQRQGYTAYKTKGRPWFDLWAQVEAVARTVPESFKLDLDFNDTLLDAERAIPILKQLEKYGQIDIYETPIPQADVPGNQAIRKATRVQIAMHYGNPPPAVALKEEICDGFVVGGGAREVMDAGAVCAMADKPFWLQLVGTGITAAFSLHFGAVLSHARWPAVNCHQLFQHSLLTAPIQVVEGFAQVPEGPGLGYEIDKDAVKRYRTDKPAQRPEPRRLIEISWADGRRMYIANTGQVNFMLHLAMQGKIPYYERGVQTRLLPDDGSDRWRELYERARKEPVFRE
jgi:galactonate dehydratase